MSVAITPIIMPKWGLEMREGTVTAWLVDEGARIDVGTPIIDVETDKISNAVEAADAGVLRRKVAQEGETLPVKALLGVLADASVSEADIDGYVAGYVVPAAGAEEEEAAATYSFVDVDGLRLRYVRRGPAEGVPVLLLHGFGGDLDNWMFNLDALAETAPVIALDLPGHGQSAARLPGAKLSELAGCVARFLEAIGVDQVHAVGHSMGGAIAAKMALDHPARVKTVALVNSAGLGDEISAAYIDGFVAATSRRELKPVVEQLFANAELVSRQLLDDLLKYKRIDGVTEVLRNLASSLFPGGRQCEQPGRELGRTNKPVLVVWGKEDRVIPSAHAANAPPRATVHLLDGAGHMAMMEKASDVSSAIRRHVAE
jgi:pyruvate dehydrogenase E2 component (dihydrolipoamide acetyltransferase)